MNEKIIVAVGGQPNSGKSTIFNMLTGARQFVANYPGITVEKKTGFYRYKGTKLELVDLPGTYSLTSYSLEERVSRDFLLHEAPDVVVDVVDASNLERNLYLAFQLAEMDLPLVIALNMMDIAKARGLDIDIETLSRELQVPVVPTVGNKSKGKKELQEAIHSAAAKKISPIRLNYGKELEEILARLENKLQADPGIKESRYPLRWLAVKLMENDSEAKKLVKKYGRDADTILADVDRENEQFTRLYNKSLDKVIAQARYRVAEEIAGRCIYRKKPLGRTLTDKIDRIVCNRFFGPIFLVATIYVLYELAIVQGYKLTDYTWPVLAGIRNLIASVLPEAGFVFDPLWRTLPLGVIDGIMAVLNYIPIFLILFALIAILEDTGYMARMAFILDRIFKYFGLHGQSILPLVLGGLYVGGCAIPGVMSCRGIKDERARMATIMIVPLMNCLAKIPLYVLLISIFFTQHKGLVMFFIATITILVALPVAKLLSISVLKTRETAPFVLEMPTYHLPTFQGILRRSIERVWLFVKKIITIVTVVMIIVYVLITFPGLNQERRTYYKNQENQEIGSLFGTSGEDNPYQNFLAGSRLMEFIKYEQKYKKAEMGIEDESKKMAIDHKFLIMNPEFFKIANKGVVSLEKEKMNWFTKYLATYNKDKQAFLSTWYKSQNKNKRAKLKAEFYRKWQNINHEFFAIIRIGSVNIKGNKIIDKDAKEVAVAYKKLSQKMKMLRKEIKDEVVTTSFLGRIGRFLEPITKFAGFNWRVNLALISAFAAKESSVATLGSIYQPSAESEEKLEQTLVDKEKGWTPLHALAIMLFMAMYPPCIPTLLMVRVETGSTKWMLFATIYPIVLGFIISTLVFTIGTLFNVSAMQMIFGIYVLAIVFMVTMGMIQPKTKTIP
ncbi:MAG: ferrous iron transport protein B [Candidatus Hydrogenedentota bacterium]